MKLLTDFQCTSMQNCSITWLVCWLSKYFFKCTSVFVLPGPENPCCFVRTVCTRFGVSLHAFYYYRITAKFWTADVRFYRVFLGFLKENSDLGLVKKLCETSLAYFLLAILWGIRKDKLFSVNLPIRWVWFGLPFCSKDHINQEMPPQR